MRAGGFETIIREDFLRNCLVPLEADHARLLDANVPQAQRPAETKIADAFIATVVSARDFHRHARDRNVQVAERNCEVADLQIAFDYDADRSARGLSVAIGRRQADVEQAIEHHGRIERAQLRIGHRAVARGKRGPDAIVCIVVAVQTVFEHPVAAADRTGDGVGSVTLLPSAGRVISTVGGATFSLTVIVMSSLAVNAPSLAVRRKT